jgi:hypothetical protein
MHVGGAMTYTLLVLADAMTLFVAVIPLALVCAFRVARVVVRTREPPRAHAHDLALFAAAVLAFPAELAMTALIRARGGWQVHGPGRRRAARGQRTADR